MDIDQLRNFTCVAECRNITAAAAKLHLSQSALSRSIQRLEESVGQPLFQRKSRSVELTDAGRRFQTASEEILQVLADAQSAINDDGRTGKLRIGSIPTIAPYLMPALLRSFSDSFPEATVLLTETTTDELVKMLQQGDVDLVVMAEPVSAKHLDLKRLFKEELYLLLPVGHELCDRDSITFQDIQNESFVMLDEAHCLSESINTFCQRGSFLPVSVERASQLATVQEMVSLSHGISMIPKMVRSLDNSPHRVYRSFADPRPERWIILGTNPYRFQSRLLQKFQDHVVDFTRSSEN
ncbi:MAG: LysR family transcriptional regulator [Planctomycetota bacterium]